MGYRAKNRISTTFLIALLALGFAGCGADEPETPDVEADVAATPEEVAQTEAAAEAARPSGPLQFVDVTEQAGIRFRHNSGAFGEKYLPETMGSGCAFLDFNNDGWQDVLLVNSADWPGHKRQPSYPELYKNNGDGTFADVTSQMGLAVEMYGIGCAVADYDADGFEDVFVSCVGPDRLFRNVNGMLFVDATAGAGVADPGFGASAAWVDYDRDGALDLFVCNYVDWSIAADKRCSLDGTNKSYCTPELYPGQSNTLYRNRGNGTFENATKRAGVFDPTGKSMGVALVDYDSDGWTDLFVANDTQPNKLYRNKGDGTFEDVAPLAGVAFSETGTPRGGMGVDAADLDGSGRPSLVVGNFTNEKMSLYKNEGGGLFTDEAGASAIADASRSSVTFASFFFDYDLDGLLDLLAVNGHVADDIAKVQPQLKHAQVPHLFRNRGGRKFDVATGKVGPALGGAIVGRGAAYADYDLDGDLDLLVTENNGPARLLRNDGGNQNDALRVRLVGAGPNRSAIGAKVVLVSGKRRSSAMVKSGSSYCSQSELPVTFGLGKAEGPVRLEVVWPGGQTEAVADVQPNQELVIAQGKGVAGARPLAVAR